MCQPGGEGKAQRDKINNDSEDRAVEAKSKADQTSLGYEGGVLPQPTQSTGILLLPRRIRDPFDLGFGDK